MILIKAKFLRTQIKDSVFKDKDGKEIPSRHFLFNCQKTDLDNSMIPVILTTKDLETSKILESHLSDGEFHLIPIDNARVNSFSMNGTATYTLDSTLILHPKFSDLDAVFM